MSSILARIPVPGYTGYSASKAGLLAGECDLPGWVATDRAGEGIGLLADALAVTYDDAFEQAMRECRCDG